MGLFKKKAGGAVAVVDYEYWYYAMENAYGSKPDVSSFTETLKSKYDVRNVYFFGRFVVPELMEEVSKIKEAGGEIVDAQDQENFKNDRIEFYMLDYIYRSVMSNKDIGTVIIFTCDGGFVPVAKFLKEKMGLKIVFCGIRNTLAGKFKLLTDDIIEVPGVDAVRNRYYDMIIDNFRYIHRHKDRTIYPTFLSTVTAVARLNDVSEDDVRNALQELIDKKIIYKVEVAMNQGENSVRVLRLDKAKAQRNGLYLLDVSDKT